jgi:hypothetical protein
MSILKFGDAKMVGENIVNVLACARCSKTLNSESAAAMADVADLTGWKIVAGKARCGECVSRMAIDIKYANRFSSGE